MFISEVLMQLTMRGFYGIHPWVPAYYNFVCPSYFWEYLTPPNPTISHTGLTKFLLGRQSLRL